MENLPSNLITTLTYVLMDNFSPCFMIEQKGITFDHEFGYSFPLFSSLLKKEGRTKGELISRIKIHAFLLTLVLFRIEIMLGSVFLFLQGLQILFAFLCLLAFSKSTY